MNDLPSHCPDCGQALAEPQRPVGSLGSQPVWCATCEGCHAVAERKLPASLTLQRIDPQGGKGPSLIYIPAPHLDAYQELLRRCEQLVAGIEAGTADQTALEAVADQVDALHALASPEMP